MLYVALKSLRFYELRNKLDDFVGTLAKLLPIS